MNQEEKGEHLGDG